MFKLFFYAALLVTLFQVGPLYRLPASQGDSMGHIPDDSSRIREFLGIATNHLALANRMKADLDTAYYYTRRAISISESIHSRIWKAQCLIVLGNYYFEIGDKKEGLEHLLQAMTEARIGGSLAGQLRNLRLMANYVCVDSTLFTVILSARDRIIMEYPKSDERTAIFDTVGAIVSHLVAIGKKAFEKKDMVEYERSNTYALDIGKKSPRINIEPYESMFYLNFYQGNMTRAFSYALEGVKIVDRGISISDEENAYVNLAYMYFQLGNMDESISYYKKTLGVLRKKGMAPNGRLLKGMTRALLKAGRPRDALALLQEKYERLDSADVAEKEAILPECMGLCYEALKEYEKAEQFYLQSLEKSKLSGKARIISISVSLSDHYISTKQYGKAKSYLQFLLEDSNLADVPPSVQANLNFQLFQADSADGNYLAAIRDFDRYKAINDSIFNATKNRQIEDLKIQFETEKKDRNIELLNKQATLQASRMQQERLQFAYETEVHKRDIDRISYDADRKGVELKMVDYAAKEKDKNLQLKERDIKLLEKQEELQQAALKQTRFLRDVSIGGTLILIALLGLLLNRYRLKQRSNRILQEQQERINRSNIELLRLTENQQKLLTEKEWLVREIHHRVKNNLQIIISLLNAQSDSLEGSSAQRAIQASQERMHAIALIHQKLYLRDESLSIDMRSYIHELVTYLGSSFASSGKIHFNLEVEHIELNISQAVPLGLILNEAITNAVKYAFPQDRSGSIHVVLKHLRVPEILLSIADDGQGFSENKIPVKKGSLGIELMELFAEQMGASIQRINDHGVSITLVFKQLFPARADEIAEAM